MTRPLLFAFALSVACSSSVPALDAATAAPCPTTAPVDGVVCAWPSLLCTYARCATEGFISASCDGSDGGSRHWNVTTSPCAACSGTTTCTGDTVCSDRIGGALIAACTAQTCGVGPIDCTCACGAGVDCTIYAAPGSDGALFGCYSGCGLCP